ncbi:isoleucine--tRNA ligase, cytoplasmic-like isoform X2 [Callithrix jacchus]
MESNSSKIMRWPKNEQMNKESSRSSFLHPEVWCRRAQEEEREFLYGEKTVRKSPNVTDQWILSFLQSLIGFFETEMAADRLYAVVPRLVKFVPVLTDWYIRVNHRRLKAPYMPFVTELCTRI